jgi:hypothetical protein
MIKETFAFLPKNTYSGSSTLVLETLNLQNSSIALLLTSNEHRTETQQQTIKQEQIRTHTPKKGKLKKSIPRDRALCYGHKSARNIEDGATVEKKQLSEGLCYKREQRNHKLHSF